MRGKSHSYIYERDATTCQYCGNRADTVDHLVPVRNGGRGVPDNLVAACRRCNTIKGHMDLPNLTQAFLTLIDVGRTSSRAYPILLWQALLLAYPVEDIPWTQRRTKWGMRKLADLLFRNPDEPCDSLPPPEVYLLLSRALLAPFEDIRSLATRMVANGYITDVNGRYTVGSKVPPPPEIRLPLPDAPQPIGGGAFPLVGTPRRWFTAIELKHVLRKEISRLSPTRKLGNRDIWRIASMLEAVYDCEPYFLVDQRVSLSLLAQKILEQVDNK